MLPKQWVPRPRVDNAAVKALARAFRWRRMLDDGVHAMLMDLAKAEGMALSYVSRVLRLTLLAPGIVEAILDGRQPEGLRLGDLEVEEGAASRDRREAEAGRRAVVAGAAGC